MQAVTDEQACDAVSANIQRILAEQDQSVYWLMKQLKMSPGAVYPIVRGEHVPSISTIASIAEILGVTVNDLIKPQENSAKRQIRKKSKKSA